MRRWIAVAILLFSWTAVLGPIASPAQQDQTEGVRKLVNKVVPAYPELARRLNVKGTVKLEARVAPNGTVKFLDVKGGNPLLVQAAQNAILKWRWEPASHETREPIEVNFNPH
jgi:TonB family protein